ncbi:MAG: methyltransferase [Kofleriaceae bacterium]
MASARGKEFDLATELAKPSFTAGQRDVPALIELVLAGDDRAGHALAKLGEPATRALAARLETTPEAGKARLVGVLGALARAGDAAARTRVLGSLGDASSRVRRAAIVALGRLDGEDSRAALIARWDAGDATPDEQRALAEALGKLGGTEALARLAALESGDDAELARRRDRALLMADRSARRDEVSTIALDTAPPSPVLVRLGSRGGLGGLLVAELTALGFAPRPTGDSGAELLHAGPWAPLFASRLWVNASIRLSFATRAQLRGRDRVVDPGTLAAAITRAIASPETRALLAAWTRGPIRWRLGFARGHKRSIVWRVARDVTAAAPELVNDPTATTWEFSVDEEAGTLDLVPRRFDDPRFAWRVAEIPAASHPTVAAALAFVAEVRREDRVWDPFCGSGVELVERARRGPVGALHGSDLDDTALTAARANLAAAGVTATLALADARTHDPGTVDLVITNPPLGGRIRLDAAALLGEALPNFVRRLAPGGRLVWITPSPRRTAPVAESVGLVRSLALGVDLGGMRGQLERWNKPRT